MKQVISYLRIKEWLASKVVFMFGILLLFYYCISANFDEVLLKTVAYFLYVSMFLAISYVVNDFADMEIDKMAGKKKVITNMPKWLIWSSLIVMAVIGNTLVLICADDKLLCVVFIILIYFLGLAYSTLGIRFKERGIWGLIECSFAQRCMPLLMILVLVKLDITMILMLVGWIVLSFIDGLRYIIIHQVNDLKNDVVAGVNTYVNNKKGNYRKLIIGLLITEIIIICILLISLWVKETIVTIIFVFVNVGLEYCIYIVIQKYAMKDIFLTYDSVPMEAFYNALFPILSGLCMISLDMRWFVVLFIMIAICFNPFLVKCKIAAVYIESKVKK